jgi:hypothetical protein
MLQKHPESPIYSLLKHCLDASQQPDEECRSVAGLGLIDRTKRSDRRIGNY